MNNNFDHLTFSANSDPEKAADMLHAHGAILVRGALSSDYLDRFSIKTQNYFDILDQQKNQGQLVPMRSWTYKFGVASPFEIDSEEVILSDLCFMAGNSCLAKISRAFFKSEELFIENKRIVLRRQSPDNTNRQIPYHQDLYTQTPGISGVINFWSPFIDCGIDAPSVEVVTVNYKDLLQTRAMPLFPENESFDKIHITKEVIEENGGAGKFWHPVMHKGDCLAFLDAVVHRTYVTPEMTKERMSMEIRIISDKSIGPEFNNRSGLTPIDSQTTFQKTA
jgi:hypothetical protein